jgi:Tfp pilus assembly protein FimT
MRGFTFVELLIIIAIIATLLALTIPLGINFYKREQLTTTTEGVIQALRRAQLQAMSQSDYSFGVYLGSDQTGEYILFRGDSYKNHDDEEVFDISSGISVSGLSEVVISKVEGIPSISGDIVLTSDNDIMTININERGRVNYE